MGFLVIVDALFNRNCGSCKKNCHSFPFTLPCRKDHQHLSRFFYQLETIKPAGRFTEPINYKDIFSGAHKRELLICITDFYEEKGEISELLTSFVALRHEIMLFHLIGRNELEFSFRGYQAVEDLETGQVMAIDPGKEPEGYRQQLTNFINDKKAFALNKNIFYRLTALDEPVDKALRDFINQRNKLKA
ncbi:MAG: hypothetical protein EOP49_50850 [Sphingobacteriales bacterium]|nr:MAG: hypothetical protein EOP49_50850 [Sphingobacteriales bacterium]